MYVCIYVSMYLCMYVSMYVYVCVYVHRTTFTVMINIHRSIVYSKLYLIFYKCSRLVYKYSSPPTSTWWHVQSSISHSISNYSDALTWFLCQGFSPYLGFPLWQILLYIGFKLNQIKVKVINEINIASCRGKFIQPLVESNEQRLYPF